MYHFTYNFAISTICLLQLLNILEAYVISKGYNYGRFDGETKPDARIGIVREFNNNPDVFICLVSTK